MSYVQIVLLTTGLGVALVYFGKNHLDRLQGVTYYNWLHPRFATLGLSILSAMWLLVLPIFHAASTRPWIPVLALLLCGSIVYITRTLLPWWKKYLIALAAIPLFDLLIGGMPSVYSNATSLAIMNLAPTLYIYYHNSDGARVAIRHDHVKLAYVVWFVGHIVVYGSLVLTVMGKSHDQLMWVLTHPKQISLSIVVAFAVWLVVRIVRRTDVSKMNLEALHVRRESAVDQPQFFIKEPF